MGKFKDLWNKLTKDEKDNVRNLVDRGADPRLAIVSERIWGVIGRVLGGIFLIILAVIIIKFCSSNFNSTPSTCQYHNQKEYLTFTFYNDIDVLEFKCSKCEHTYESPQSSFEIERNTVKEPTCQVEGIEHVKIKFNGINGYIIDDDYTIKTVKCVIGEISSNEVPSTCITHGKTASGPCKWCKEIVASKELPLADCTYEVIEYVEPTCLSEGSSGKKQCIYCDTIIGNPEVLEKVECSYNPSYVQEKTYTDQNALVGICKWCNFRNILEVYGPAISEDYFTFEVDLKKKEAYITSFIGECKEINIPAYFNGYPIKKINENVFSNNATLESITFEEGIQIIGEKSFKNCSSLKNISLPDSLLVIEKEAFKACKELRRINTGNADIYQEAFMGCYNLRIFEQDNSGFIGNDAFKDCPKLFFMKFSKSVPAYKNFIFDSSVENTGDIDNYCRFTSGNNELIDDFYYGETFEDIFNYKDGFYYVNYEYDSDRPIISFDINEKQIRLPDNTKAVYGSAFVSTPDELTSVICPSSLSRIYSCNRIYNNIVFYFEGSNVLENQYDQLTGSLYDESTQLTIEYECYGYCYSKDNKEGGPYWYYDSTGKIKMHKYPYVNYSNYNYSSIGDSITLGIDGQTGEKMENPYSSLINSFYNFQYFNNKASLDATLADTNDYDSLYDQVYRIPQSSKVITVMLGINDFINNIELGNIESPQMGTIYQGIESAIKVMKNRFTNPYILFITPLNQFKYDEVNDIGVKLIDIVNAIKEICEKYDIDVLDAYSLCEFNQNTDPNSDGIHPTQGFVTSKLYPLILDYMEENMVI